MLKIEELRKLVLENKIRWTNHVVVRLIQRNIQQNEVKNAILNGEIIEQYEKDYPYPSVLFLGIVNNKSIHIICGTNGEELWIITAYYLESSKWDIDKKTRKGDNV